MNFIWMITAFVMTTSNGMLFMEARSPSANPEFPSLKSCLEYSVKNVDVLEKDFGPSLVNIACYKIPKDHIPLPEKKPGREKQKESNPLMDEILKGK